MAEQSVERLRKPEDVAQPGGASPVQVAAISWRRRRAANPMGGSFVGTAGSRRTGSRCNNGHIDSIHTLDASEGHERMKGVMKVAPQGG
jgi:hypothetical protein